MLQHEALGGDSIFRDSIRRTKPKTIRRRSQRLYHYVKKTHTQNEMQWRKNNLCVHFMEGY